MAIIHIIHMIDVILHDSRAERALQKPHGCGAAANKSTANKLDKGHAHVTAEEDIKIQKTTRPSTFNTSKLGKLK